MRTFKTLLTMIAMLMCSISVSAYYFQANGIYFNVTSYSDLTVAVTYHSPTYHAYSGTVTIPSAVTFKGETYNVTSIGEAAFAYCKDLTEIIIPEGVTRIGHNAFYDCDGLTDITIPKGVFWIGYYAFYECSNLTSITMPTSVTEIYKETFRSCSSLTNINIPEGVTSIDEGAFRYCGSLKDITIPESVTSIEDYAFSGCSSLTDVTIPESVTSIGDYAFSSCSSLTDVTILEGMTSIGNYVFKNCSSLTNVTIPESVTSIEWYAFSGCSNLTDITIPTSVADIGGYAFEDCSSLTNITIPDSVTIINKGTFENCSSLTNVNIPTGVWKIEEDAFYGCSSLTNVNIPEGMLYILEDAFCNCSSLTSITIPASMRNIKDDAFFNCKKLYFVFNYSDLPISTYSDKYGSIGYYAKKVFNANNLVAIGDFLFETNNDTHSLAYYAGKESNVVLPNNYNGDNYKIGDYAFYGHPNLKSLTIGSGVLSIGYDQTKPAKTIWLTNTPPSGYSNVEGKINYVANDKYTYLDNMKIYPYLSSMFEVDGVKYVPVNPSERTCDAIDCTYEDTLENIAIKSTVSFKGIAMAVKEIMPYTFYQNEYIKDLSVNNCGNIGDCAFQNCTDLQNIKLVDGITSIGSAAFSGCSSLNRIDIPNSVNELGESVLNGCTELETLKVGNSIRAIPPYAFQSCSALCEIVIPQSATSIGDCAFRKCTALTNVIIEDRDSTLAIGSNGWSTMFSDCPLDSVYIGGDISYNTSEYYGYSPFYRNTTLRTVVITDKEDEIYDNEFYGCTNLKNVTIGDGVKKIGNWAFSGCSNLDYFAFGKNVESIGEEAFSDCVNVTQLISSAATPPTCGTQALDDINKWSCTLKVPMESLTAYQQADQWKDFFFMEGVETSINSIKPSNGKADAYSTDGRLIQRNADIKSLKKGLYIINGKKVMVR